MQSGLDTLLQRLLLLKLKNKYMKFKAYNKIHGIHKEECEGILEGVCHIQEKVDGANASIWLEDDEVHYGSRSRDLFKANDNFNGFGDWVKSHEGIKQFLQAHPDHRLNGEWLVRHTIGYKELNYKKFYLFDITKEMQKRNEEGVEETVEITLDIPFMYELAEKYEIPAVHLFGTVENPTMDQLKAFAGTSMLGEKGEGIVIKNLSFVNKFGVQQWGKFVTQEFKEDNGITFGGNNKHSESYEEMYYVNKMMTLPRVQKVLHKLESSEGRLSEKHIPRVMGTCYHDLISEEGWVIAQELGKTGKMFNFKTFKSLCDRKAKSIFLEILTGDISVANL